VGRVVVIVVKVDNDSVEKSIEHPSPADLYGDMQRRLLTVAADLFRRKGYAGATTRELADLMGLKKASLYHYLKSKEDLLYDLCALSVHSISEEVEAAIKDVAPEDRLRSAIQAHVHASIRDRDLHSVMWTEFRYLDPPRQLEIKTRRANYERQIRKLVREGQLDGRLRQDIDCKYLTLLLLNLLNWTIFWFDPAGPLEADDLVELLASQFIEGAQGIAADPG
jgi:AcrR family transcriptional regulator